ncbi:helix-turn-helix transcriptional regulator [Paenibacillus sp. D2_2]|uniref:helix-turn-helix domain-containing protein n=1 Tax=Paenibacillus sp. D2_2 TaxID=3073092 RepID=UPI00281601E0|nr:helix-turn-helix transcriptional regulator [Paenibacillus sp. D2_2]WMT42794.1 helix-turn-helix transcriptional regulator [Paenibacillus sp. D2_2]
MSLGENIKKFRKEKKLTQFQLAEKSSLSRSYIADVEKDRYSPSLDTLKTIAKALDITVSKLIGEHDDHSDLEKTFLVNNEVLTEDEIKVIETALKQYREMKEIAKER